MGCGASTDNAGNASHPQNVNSSSGGEVEGKVVIPQGEAANEFSDKIIDENGNEVDKYATKSKNRPESDSEAANMFEVEETGDGEQFMAVKPWLGAIVKPSNPPQFVADPPNKALQLEYVYGYRAIDSRQNVFYTSDQDKVVYMTAALGIVLNKADNTQQFFGGGEAKAAVGHNDDISALAISNDRKLVCTGQRGKIPIICIWKATSGERVAQFSQDRNTRSVKACSFNKNGQYIGTVGDDDQHSVFVFGIDGTKIASTKGGTDPILDCAWSPTDNTLYGAGKRGVTLFEFDGVSLTAKRGLFGDPNLNTAMCSVTFGPDGTCYTGGATGTVFVWKGRQLGKSFNVGNGMINGISVTDSQIVVGADNTIAVYDTSYNKVTEYPTTNPARAVDIKNGCIVAGLRDGTIIEIDQSGNQKTIMYSHSDGESWGLDVDKSGVVVSCGDDNKLIVWDPNTRKSVANTVINEKAGQKAKILGASTLSVFPPNQCARAVAISSKSGHIAVGVNNGEVHIHESVKNINNVIKVIQDSKEWIECMAYSPDGKKFAVGSHDNALYVYDATSYDLLGKGTGGTSFITSLDWSTDSNYIQTVNGAYEYLFYEASGKRLPSGASMLKDEPWSTFSCKFGWPVQGIFPAGTDGSHVNGVDRSKAKDVFATGDDWGLVNLYRNPALQRVKCVSFRAHSSHVVRVKFDAKDQRLYSIGGYDRTMIQWKVK